MIYAVNKRTKKHYSEDDFIELGIDLGAHELIQADADGWIEWSGGECPLLDNSRCDYIMDVGYPSLDERAGSLRWKHDQSKNSNITHYRPIIDQPASEEPKGWDGDGLPPVGTFVDVSDKHIGELMYGGGEKNCEVVSHVEGVAVIRMSYGLGCMDARVLVPSKSPREQWVEKAKDLLDENAQAYLSEEYLENIASVIHDALASGELPTPEKTQ